MGESGRHGERDGSVGRATEGTTQQEQVNSVLYEDGPSFRTDRTPRRMSRTEFSFEDALAWRELCPEPILASSRLSQRRT